MTKLLVPAISVFVISTTALAIGVPSISRPESVVQNSMYNAAPLSVVGVEPQKLYQSIVSIRNYRAQNKYYFCIGTLVATSKARDLGFVLTAGHCLLDAQRIEVRFYGASDFLKPTIVNALDWHHHAVMLPPPGLVDRTNAAKDHDIGMIMIDRIPTNARKMLMAEDLDPRTLPATIPVFTVGRNVFDIQLAMSPLVALPMQDPDWYGNTAYERPDVPDGKSRFFSGRIVQPEGADRGACGGDSGAPVLLVYQGNPSLMAIHRGGTSKIQATDLVGGTECVRQTIYYNTSYAGRFMSEAVQLMGERNGKRNQSIADCLNDVDPRGVKRP